ncbi:alpha/beta hydrolase [Iamia sp. SCSIO 61187]|uniref:alpha/beta hydrolase n=1 Tax=Iamia sp. SCSIO 61187 TaxID=2722752 RepID=UPI001C63AAEF|nr:alpha/beta hydrolase [Iamia sp. SCSIO 61187]QYG93731.1 alpha/beta hydrolase [Iamia sp. SCSIO 61187]
MRRRPSPFLVAAAALLLVVSACTDVEPTAVVRDDPAGADAPTSTTTTDPDAGSDPPPPVGDDLGPDVPADFAALSPWAPCAGSFECATLTVPRDWADPEGDTIDLAVTRHPAEGDRIGSLLVNPGGPGASGVEFTQGFVGSGLPDGLTERFDVVSWDPRGTGGANRVDCTTDQDWLEPDIDPTVEDQADIDLIRTETAAAVARCEQAAGDLLAVVGTRATVRDLDALRGVLGDEGLTYVGYSYGTTIGMEYLRMYPGRVRAMVLDGVSVPGVDPIVDAHVQAQGFERTLDAYLADCPRRATCPLGEDPKATLLDLVARLEAERIEASYQLGVDDAAPRDGTVGVGELYIAVAASLYDDSSWPILDQGLEEALGTPAQGRTLLALRDQYLGRQVDGTWADDADARSTIRCADQAERSEQPEGDLALAEDWAAELPFWGAWFGTGNPGCWGAPEAVEPLLPLDEAALAGLPPVVVIGTTNDPATPYEQAEDAAELIDGSVLVTYEGDVHTAYRSLSDCVDDAVTPYLVDLAVPPSDLVCA